MATSSDFQVRVHCVDGLSRTAAAVHNRVSRMASLDLGMIEPNIAILEWGHGIRIEIACHDTDHNSIRILMSSTPLLFFARQRTPAGVRWLYRYVHFDITFDVTDVSAAVENGILRISATHRNAPEEKKFQLCVA